MFFIKTTVLGSLMLLCAYLPMQAQERVTGTVVDDGGLPIPGVTVKLNQGTAAAVRTDSDGRFFLSLAPADTTASLVVTAVGYVSQTVPVQPDRLLTIRLEPESKTLNEVVVVGYGTQQRKDITGAVASVKAAEFVKGGTRDAGQLLQGKVAGLSISTPTGNPTQGAQILLRGTNTLTGDNSPLVLIDGVPGSLRTVAPEDIESVDVLKDGSSAAIYGTRATNGVILITTKKASAGQTLIDYHGYASTDEFVSKPRLLTADEFRQQIANNTIAATDYGGDTDWLDAITRKPVSQVHNLSIRGSAGETSFLANLNYRDFQGIFKKSDNRAVIGRITLNHAMFDDKLNLSVSYNGNNQWYTTTGDGSSFNNGNYNAALVTNPTLPIYKADVLPEVLENQAPYNGIWAQPPALVAIPNPLSLLEEANGQNRNQRNRVYGTITYRPIPALRIHALLSTERMAETRGYRESFQHFLTTVAGSRNGYASRGTTTTRSNLMELTAQYNTEIDKHRISILGGYGYQDNLWEDYWMQSWNFPSDEFGWHNIGLGRANNDVEGAPLPMGSNKTSNNLISFFGRVNYNYDDRYLATLSIRREADSRFLGSDQPWGTFPAASVAWRLKGEPFLADVALVNELKIRAGHGVTGIAPVNPYLALYRLGYTGNNNTFYYNGEWVNLLVPQSNPNPGFTWEKKREFNLGVDFSLLDNRIGGTIDAYSRQTVDLLYNYPVPVPPNVFGTMLANVGVIENRGLEVMINTVPIRSSNFEWTSSLLFSTNSNTLKSINDDRYQLTSDFFYVGDVQPPVSGVPTHRVKVGEPIGQIWGWKVLDISDDGKWIYENQEGEAVPSSGVTPEDRQVLGNGLPKYYGGWNNSFRYKNLDLDITMRGAFDYQIVNFMRIHYENFRDQSMNNLKAGYEPVMGKAVLTDGKQFNSYYVENGDFWKIDNITLGYNFPGGWFKGHRSARIYVSTLNTFVFTGYKGLDPEVTRMGLAPGTDDRYKYPTTRTYTLGINLNF